LRTTLRDTRNSRQIVLIGLFWAKYARRIFAIVSTTSIPDLAPVSPTESHCGPAAPGVPIGCRSPRKRGPYSTPIHIKALAERLNPKRPMCYIIQMAKTRPLIKTTYRVVPLKDGTFAVEIAVTGTRPTTAARAFATAAEAEAWIVREKLK